MNERFQENYEILRQNYTLTLRDKLTELVCSTNDLEELYRITHSISGSCGMFGFSRISEAAHKLEEILKPVVKGNADIKPETGEQISLNLNNLIREMETAL